MVCSVFVLACNMALTYAAANAMLQKKHTQAKQFPGKVSLKSRNFWEYKYFHNVSYDYLSMYIFTFLQYLISLYERPEFFNVFNILGSFNVT